MMLGGDARRHRERRGVRPTAAQSRGDSLITMKLVGVFIGGGEGLRVTIWASSWA